MRAGLLVNPSSAKVGRKGLALAAMLAGKPDIPIRILDDFTGLHSALEALAMDGVTDLFISSGDGTVQAIQTILAESSPFPSKPRLGLLAHGTTNMTAADLGVGRRSVAAQAEFLASPQPRLTRSRHTLRVANPGDGMPRHGMFLGTGAVWRAVQFCQEAVHKAGLRGELATFATLAAAIAKSIVSRPSQDDETRIDRAYDITVSHGDRRYAEGGQLLVLATTLNKLILGTRPFWGGATQPLRVSIFPYPVPSLVRWLIPMMYGGESRQAPPGAISFTCNAFDVKTTTPFVIDGEFFDPPAHKPLRVELGPSFDYIYG